MSSKVKALIGITVSVLFMVTLFAGTKGGYRAVRSSDHFPHRQ